VHKWSVRDVPFYLKFWAKVTYPFENGDFPTFNLYSLVACQP